MLTVFIRNTKTVIAIAIVALTISTDALSQRAGQISGPGSATCGAYLAERQSISHENTDFQFSAWVFGFLSSYNTLSLLPQIKTMPESSTILAYLDKYCRDNPLKHVSHGTACLVADLGGWRPPYCGKT